MAIQNHKILEGDYTGRDVASAPDRLTGTAAENKATFDRLAKGVSVPRFNSLIDELAGKGADTLVSSDTVKKIRINPDRALEVTYDNVIWETTASSGHVIVDPNGNPLPQRTRMKFTGSAVTDEGGVTVVAGIKGDRGDPTAVNGKTGESITLTAADVGAANPNLLMNGDFKIWQRGENLANLTWNKYGPDRWATDLSGTGQLSAEKTAVGAKFTLAGTNSWYGIHQTAENFLKLAGKTVTASIRFKTTCVSTQSTIDIYDGISHLLGYGLLHSNWQTVTVTAALSASMTTLSVGIGLAGAAGDVVEIEYAKLEIGSAATAFCPRLIAEELALCQRYFRKSYNLNVAPGTASSVYGIEVKVLPSDTIANGQNYGKVEFGGSMRVSPTVTIYPFTTPSNTGRVSGPAGGDLAANSGAVNWAGETGFIVCNNSGGSLATNGNSVIFNWIADAEIY